MRPDRTRLIERRRTPDRPSSAVDEMRRLARAYCRIDDAATRQTILALAELYAARERRSAEAHHG